jgi:hypothetical protein
MMSNQEQISPVEEPIQSPSGRTVWFAFCSLIVLGVLLRCVAGSYSLGFVHPDEHQQYLEAAQGIRYGYNFQYWEYVRGVRHYLYPGVLAGELTLCDWLGISDPVMQAKVIRILMGVAILGCFGAISYRWIRQQRLAAALFLMTFAALFPDMIFISVRTLSETAVMIPLLMALAVWDRSRLLAGICFGICFAVRFQSGFFIVAAFGIELFNDWRHSRPWKHSNIAQLAVGLAASLFVVGAIDYFTWGSWFHSSIEYFRANILEGKAAGYGTEPWYQYLVWCCDMEIITGVCLAALAIFGSFKEPRWAILIALFFFGHSLTDHKEFRFLWPTLPLILLLASIGFEEFYVWMKQARMELIGCFFVAIAFLPGCWYRAEDIDWLLEPKRSISLALADVGKLPDVQGVVVFGIGDDQCGNYFFLRKNIPYITLDTIEKSRENEDWRKPAFNYLITRPQDLDSIDNIKAEQVNTIGEWGIYRFKTTPAAIDGKADLNQ